MQMTKDRIEQILEVGYLSNDDESFSELDAEATREYLESLHSIENLDEMEDDEVLKWN